MSTRRLAGVAVAGVAFAAFAALAGACGIVAGLPSDYELASDGGRADDVRQIDAASDAIAADGASLDAGTSETAAQDAAADAGLDAKPPKVPPSDPANVSCGASKCALLTRVCCQETSQAVCQDRTAINCSGGVVARCDEAASCLGGDVCCVTDIKPFGLETTCQQACSGADPQACRKDSECANGATCVAWTCNGRVVATCNARGSDAGCL